MIKVKESRGRRLIGVDEPAPPDPKNKIRNIMTDGDKSSQEISV